MIICYAPSTKYFYPRPPRGGRLTREYYYSGREQFLSTPSARRATHARNPEYPQDEEFLSTPSARRATGMDCKGGTSMKISIHALREEGDMWYQFLCLPW